MASTSTVSPNKSILQTHNHDVPLSQLKWIIKNPTGHSRRSGNHTQLANHDSAAELPDPNSSNEETPTDQNQVLTEEPAPKKPKPQNIYIRLRGSKNKAPEAEAETEVEDQNPSSAAAAVSALASEEAEEVLPKTWNLRPRKTVPKPNGEASALKTGAPVVQYNKIQEAVPSRGTKGGQKKKKKEKRMEISLTLTKEEIEEDIYLMTGQKPSRRPKRRPKNVQKQLDVVIYLRVCFWMKYQWVPTGFILEQRGRLGAVMLKTCDCSEHLEHRRYNNDRPGKIEKTETCLYNPHGASGLSVNIELA